MKKVAVFLLSIMIVFLVGCGKSSNPVVDVITSNIETGEVHYWTIYDNNSAEEIEGFEPANIEVLQVSDNDFSSEINGKKISVSVNKYELEDDDGGLYGVLQVLIDLFRDFYFDNYGSLCY